MSFWIVVFAIAILHLSCKDSADQRNDVLPKIEVAIEKTLTLFGIDQKTVATKRIKSGDGNFVRIERRIAVSSEFKVLEFNRVLSQRVGKFDATVIATEKLEDKSVAMHIKKDGVIVESVIFRIKN